MFTIYYYLISIPQPLKTLIKLQPSHPMNQFYAATNEFYNIYKHFVQI